MRFEVPFVEYCQVLWLELHYQTPAGYFNIIFTVLVF